MTVNESVNKSENTRIPMEFETNYTRVVDIRKNLENPSDPIFWTLFGVKKFDLFVGRVFRFYKIPPENNPLVERTDNVEAILKLTAEFAGNIQSRLKNPNPPLILELNSNSDFDPASIPTNYSSSRIIRFVTPTPSVESFYFAHEENLFIRNGDVKDIVAAAEARCLHRRKAVKLALRKQEIIKKEGKRAPFRKMIMKEEDLSKTWVRTLIREGEEILKASKTSA